MQTTEYFGLRDKNVMKSLFPILAEQWLTPLARRFGDGYAYSRNYAWRGPCDWGALLGDEHLHNCWGMPTYPTDRWLVGGIEFAVAIVPRIKEWIQDCYTEDRCVCESYVPISGYLLDHLQKMDYMGLNVLILSYTAYSSNPIRIIRPSHCAEVKTYSPTGDDIGRDNGEERYFHVVDISRSWSPESFLHQIGSVPYPLTREWRENVEREIQKKPHLLWSSFPDDGYMDDVGTDVPRKVFAELTPSEDREIFLNRVAVSTYFDDPFVLSVWQECKEAAERERREQEKKEEESRRMYEEIERIEAAYKETMRKWRKERAERERREEEKKNECQSGEKAGLRTNTVTWVSEVFLQQMREELNELKSVARLQVAERLKEASAWGNLTENFEYEALKNQQGFIEGRIAELEEKIRTAKIVEAPKGKNIGLGSLVTLEDEATKEKIEYQIVGSAEVDLFADPPKISDESPVGKALMNHKKGDVVTVHSPEQEVHYRIMEVRNKPGESNGDD